MLYDLDKIVEDTNRKINEFIDAVAKAAGDRPGSMSGDRYPVNDLASLKDAIRAVGRAGGPQGTEADRAKVRRHIIARARALGLSQYIPDTWNSDGTLKS